MSGDAFRDGLEDFDGYPKSWKASVGDLLVGEVARYETGHGEFGDCPICVVRDEGTGEERSVWISTISMRQQFQDLRPKPGERLGIKRLPDGRSDRGGRSYKRYEVRVDREGDEDAVPDFGLEDDYVEQRARLAEEGATAGNMSQSDALADDDLPF